MTRNRIWRPLGLLLLLLALAACSGRGQTPDDLPTLIPDAATLATSVAATENAPPPGYRETVTFDPVDTNLARMDGYSYRVELAFDGVFAGTTRPTSAAISATVYANAISSARRVLVESQGELLQRPEGEAFEAVALGPDAFLVRGGVCQSNVEDNARAAAGLSAGALVGGARAAAPTGRNEIINGLRAWEYRFALADMALPAVRFAADTRVTALSEELWVAPEVDAVARYYATLEIENARLLLNDLPVTGQLRLRYDLREANSQPNITVPFGC